MNKVIIWDFDGVILKSFEQALTIKRLEYPLLSKEEYLKQFEGNINRAVYTRQPVREIDFFAEYEKTILDALLVAGITEVIQTFDKKYNQVIVSSTITQLIDKYLTFHNLRHYFTEILGNEVSESKVEKFKLVFDHQKTSASHSLFITDTLGDLLEAQTVNLPTIAILWGFHPRATLEKGEPTTIATDPQELIKKVDEIIPA